MSEDGLTVRQLAERAGLSPTTIRSWVNAGYVPDIYCVLKLAQSLDKQRRQELLESALRWRYLRGKTYLTGEFSLKDALEELIHNTSGKSSSLSSDQLAEIIDFWKAAEEHVPGKSQLIIPPQPSVVLIDNWATAIKEIARNNNILYALDWKQFED